MTSTRQNVELTVTMYRNQGNEMGNSFKYLPGHTREFTAYSVIMGVKLDIQEGGYYTLDEQDGKDLDAFLQAQAPAQAGSSRNPVHVSQTPRTHARQRKNLADDGRRETIVEPAEPAGDRRCSQRRRRQIEFDN